MREFLRKLGWLLRRRDKEDELREELQFHLEEEAEPSGRGGVDRGSSVGGTARVGECRFGEGGYALGVGMDVLGTARPGFAVCAPDDGGEPVIHGTGGAVPGARDRGELGDLQFH